MSSPSRIVIIAALLVAVAAPMRAASAVDESPDTANITVDKATVSVFLPPPLQSAQDPEARRARALARSAIARTKQCLGKNYADYSLIFAQRIVVSSQGRSDTFEVGNAAPLVGALLLRPGSNARLIYAGGGPESLAESLPIAASDYFGKRCDG